MRASPAWMLATRNEPSAATEVADEMGVTAFMSGSLSDAASVAADPKLTEIRRLDKQKTGIVPENVFVRPLPRPLDPPRFRPHARTRGLELTYITTLPD